MNKKFKFMERVIIKDNAFTKNNKIACLEGVVMGSFNADNSCFFSIDINIDGSVETFSLNEEDLISTGKIDNRELNRLYNFYDTVKVKKSRDTCKNKIDGLEGEVIGMAPDSITWHYVIRFDEIEDSYGVVQEDLELIERYKTQ